VAFWEDEKERKMVVPKDWVVNETLMYPPKGKAIGEFIRKMMTPDVSTWRNYLITKVIEESGSFEDCNRIFNLPDSSTDDFSSDRESDITLSRMFIFYFTLFCLLNKIQRVNDKN